VTEDGVQVWTLAVEGVAHRVEASGSLRHHIRCLARAEIKRRRKQDELRAGRAAREGEGPEA